jgi:hypothetical protein
MNLSLAQLELLVEQLPDRQAIQDCVMRQARGVDRFDRDLPRSGFHPDFEKREGDRCDGAAMGNALTSTISARSRRPDICASTTSVPSSTRISRRAGEGDDVPSRRPLVPDPARTEGWSHLER